MGLEIVIAETIGIIAFAISGALVGIKKHFDIFGVVVLGVITAVGGGAIRDIILGINPPSMFVNPIYVLIAFITSVFAFLCALILTVKFKKRKKFFLELVNFFDAIGLGVFAVTGCNTAILNGHFENPFLSIFVGVITGIGGGMLRDILAMRVPFVLYKDIYASAGIIGASIFYVMSCYSLKMGISATCAIIATIFIRMIATYYNLRLPKIGFRIEK